MRSRLLTVLTLVLLVTPTVAEGQAEWRQFLRQDLVTQEGNNNVFETLELITLEVPGFEKSSFQVKTTGRAPRDFMSRDNLVSLTSSTATAILLAVLAEGYQVSAIDLLEGVDSRPLLEPIGTPDLEITLNMTSEGVQFEILDTSDGSRTRTVQTWSEVFGG